MIDLIEKEPQSQLEAGAKSQPRAVVICIEVHLKLGNRQFPLSASDVNRYVNQIVHTGGQGLEHEDCILE